MSSDKMSNRKYLQVDLNCDLGESFGPWKMGNDAEILPLISSANIACGFHAGDPQIMAKTVKLALENNVAIGAHPGLFDLQGFGRRNISITPEEAYALVVYQVGALKGFLTALGGSLHHVKPHGALYNMAATNKSLSLAIANAVADVSGGEAILYGLSGSELIVAAREVGLPVMNEVFSDRTYQEDKTLTSRSQPDALIVDPQVSVEQVIQMIEQGTVTTTSGNTIQLEADTICIHGDGVTALLFAKEIRQQLLARDIHISAALE